MLPYALESSNLEPTLYFSEEREDAVLEGSLLVHDDASEFEFLSIELSEEIVFVLFTESVLFALLDESEPDVWEEELETFVTLDSSDSFPESADESSPRSISSDSWMYSMGCFVKSDFRLE